MKIKGLVAVVGIAVLMVLGVACGNGEAAETPGSGSEATSPLNEQAGQSGSAAGGGAIEPGDPLPPVGGQSQEQPLLHGDPEPPLRGIVSSSASPATSYLTPLLQVGSSQVGISVTGEGTLSLEPDLTLVNIGVETTATTVAEARGEAASAMAAIIAAVKAYGLEDRDIQTRSFNIWPQYEFQDEVTPLGRRSSKQVLVGYRVSNTASIKVRDLDNVGVIIDDIAEAGGDATRINGISFTVEDPKPFMAALREAAVLDALAKAQQFADLTNVLVGRLVYIAEAGRGAPIISQDFGVERAFAAVSAPVATSISGGELELRLTVQALFAIE